MSRSTVVQIFFYAIFFAGFLLVSGCNSASNSETSGAVVANLCDSFGNKLGTAKWRLVRTIDGCPVYVEESQSGPTPLTQNPRAAKLAKLQKQRQVQNEQDVELFLLAQREGYLEMPEVQQRVMRYVAQSYLRDAGLEQEITDDQARRFYTENIGDFSISEIRVGRHIIIEIPKGATEEQEEKAKNEASDLYKTTGQHFDKMDFAMLANKNSDDLESARVGGMMPPTAREGEKLASDETLAETLFALQSEGDVAPPVRTDQGWHIVQLASVVPGHKQPYEKVRNMVRSG